MKCHAIMKPNMKRPQRKATTTQISSTREIGSFHQMRSGGGVTAMAFPFVCRHLAIGIEAISITPHSV